MERMPLTHRATHATRMAMDSLSSRYAVSAAFGGVLIAGATLLLLLVFVALPLVFIRHFFFSAGAAQARAPAPRGVRRELLRSLPVTVYRAEEDNGGGAVECAVCLAGLKDGEEARFLPRCGHGFHAQCVDRWLASRSTCPLCRVAVVGKPDDVSSRSTSLRPVPPEPENYARNLPAMLLGTPNQATVGAVTVTADGDRSALATAAVLVIDIPESRMAAATARAEPKPPGLLKRLWSFGRQGPSASTTDCSGGSAIGPAHVTCASPRAPV